jgi:hypothetical protein
MKAYAPLRPLAAIAAAAFVLCAAPAGWADEEQEAPFDIADLFFELNHTDSDLGIHGFVDGDAWRRLEIEDPRGREMLDLRVSGRLRKQGLTEIFFESAEPTFDELPAEAFFRRFPEGEYEFEGTTLEGEELESTDVLSHVMPAPPENLRISGVESTEDNCAQVVLGDSIVISWDPVATSHPDVGEDGPIEVVSYQLVVEQEEPVVRVFSADLPPNVTEMEVPDGFFVTEGEYKFEILVQETSGNRTAVECAFEP